MFNWNIVKSTEAVLSRSVGKRVCKFVMKKKLRKFIRINGDATKVDVFHILSRMWKTPAEKCFLWLGGFRSSKVLKTGFSSLHCCYPEKNSREIVPLKQKNISLQNKSILVSRYEVVLAYI